MTFTGKKSSETEVVNHITQVSTLCCNCLLTVIYTL